MGLPILVIDDNREMLRIVENILGVFGHTVHCVTNGEEALEYLDAHLEPFLCLIDVTLPGMSGHEVVAAMAARNHPARVILMSGQGGIAQSDAGQVVGFLSKPFGLEDLKALLDAFAG